MARAVKGLHFRKAKDSDFCSVLGSQLKVTLFPKELESVSILFLSSSVFASVQQYLRILPLFSIAHVPVQGLVRYGYYLPHTFLKNSFKCSAYMNRTGSAMHVLIEV